MVDCIVEALRVFPAFTLQFHFLLWIAVAAAGARLVLSVLTIRARVSKAAADAHNAWRTDALQDLRRYEEETGRLPGEMPRDGG